MNEEKKHGFLTIGTPMCGLLLGLIGAVIALMLLFMGFWRTLFVAALFGVGYFLGASSNKADAIKIWINKLFPPKGE